MFLVVRFFFPVPDIRFDLRFHKYVKLLPTGYAIACLDSFTLQNIGTSNKCNRFCLMNFLLAALASVVEWTSFKVWHAEGIASSCTYSRSYASRFAKRISVCDVKSFVDNWELTAIAATFNNVVCAVDCQNYVKNCPKPRKHHLNRREAQSSASTGVSVKPISKFPTSFV